MRIRRLASGVEVWTPAKLNLFLEIFHKREDGFHELETLMCPIRLYDTLLFETDFQVVGETSNPVRLESVWALQPGGSKSPELPLIPLDRGNTVVRAVELLRQSAGVEVGAKIRLIKRIPALAGLGGGSSDAAAALLGANLVWGLGRSTRELMALAAEIGSDVPYFLQSDWAMCRGRGEIIEPVPRMPRLSCVVVHPGEGLSTAAVYGRCQVADVQDAKQRRSAAPLLAALRQGRLSLAGQFLHNRLQPAAEQLTPVIRQLSADFTAAGVAAHQMSGSGTSYFGLCHHDRHARRVAAWLRSRGWATVFSTASGI